jgi:hypothetical protein
MPSSRASCSCCQIGLILFRANRISRPVIPSAFLQIFLGFRRLVTPAAARAPTATRTRTFASSQGSTHPFCRSISPGPKPSGHSTFSNTFSCS